MGKIVIIDDCLLEAEMLRDRLVAYFGQEKIYIKTEFNREFLLCNSIDLLFLDIKLKNSNGIEEIMALKKEMRSPINLVFYSNYSSLVHDTLEVRPIYFVRKSHVDKDLIKLMGILEADNFFTRRNQAQSDIDPLDIMYVESRNVYIYLHLCTGETVKKREKLDTYEKTLEGYPFLRCHKSYLVNLKHVTIILEGRFLMDSDTYVPISRRHYKDALANWERYRSKVL